MLGKNRKLIKALQKDVEQLTKENKWFRKELNEFKKMRAYASVKPRFKVGSIVTHYGKDDCMPLYKDVKILHVEIRKVSANNTIKFEPVYTFFCEDQQKLKDIREDGTILSR